MKSFLKGPPPEKAKLKRWWTYLSQFRLTVHHIRKFYSVFSTLFLMCLSCCLLLG